MRLGPFILEPASLLARPAALSSTARARPRQGTRIPNEAFGLTLKRTIDRAACMLRFALSPLPSAADWTRIAGEVADAHADWNANGWIDRPHAYHADPPVLQSPRLRRDRTTNLLHLTFESGYEPHADEPGRDRWLGYTPNRTAHAWVLRHLGPPRPWLVCIHGYGSGIATLDRAAFRASWLYNELGLNVVLPVLPLHGPRKIRWQSGDGFFGGDILDTIHAEAQALWDIRRVLSWVRAQAPVAVGIYGLSLGGYTAALLAAFDGEVDAVIAGIPATDFVELARLHSRPVLLTQATQSGLIWEQVDRVLRVISPLSLPPRVPRERLYIFGGVADCIVPAHQVRQLWKHWGQPRIAWYEGSHLSFWWETAVASFLNDALGAMLTPRAAPAAEMLRTDRSSAASCG